MSIKLIELLEKGAEGGGVAFNLVCTISSSAPAASDKLSRQQLYLYTGDNTLYYHSGTAAHDFQSLKREDRYRGAYSSSDTYAVGDIVVQSSTIYICQTAISTGETFTASKWTALSTDTNTTYAAGNGLTLTGTTFSVNETGSTLDVSSSGVKVADDGITATQIADDATYPDLKRIITAGSNVTITPNDTNKTLTLAATAGGSNASQWKGSYSSSSTYAVGDQVIYSGSVYFCETAIDTAESWDASKWERVGTTWMGTYSSSATYEIGEMVLHSSNIYICHTNITTAETFDSTKWYNLTASGNSFTLTVQEEGTALTTGATTLNFVGGKITASGTGATKTITVTNFDIHDDLSTETTALADTDRFAISDESATGDPTNYLTATNLWNYIDSKLGTGGSHTRWCGISSDSTFTASELTVSGTTNTLVLPSFNTDSYVAFAVPNTENDITGLEETGTGLNQLGGFTKASGTLTKNSVAYKYWVSDSAFLAAAMSASSWTITQ